MTKSNSTRNRFVSFNTSSLEDVHLSGEDKPLCADGDGDDDDTGDDHTAEDADTVAFCGLWLLISRLFGSCNDPARPKYDEGNTDTCGIIDR